MTTRTDRELVERIHSIMPATKFTENNLRGLMIECIQHFRSDFDPKGKSEDYLRGSVEALLDAYDQINNGGRVDEDHPLVKQIQDNRRRLAGVN